MADDETFFDAGVTFTAEGARKAFHAGLKKGGFELTELLFEQGLRINADGASPLFAAIKQGDPSLVELLLECGSNVNQQGRFGKTPLIEAFEQDRQGIAGILLARKDLRSGPTAGSGALPKTKILAAICPDSPTREY